MRYGWMIVTVSLGGIDIGVVSGVTTGCACGLRRRCVGVGRRRCSVAGGVVGLRRDRRGRWSSARPSSVRGACGRRRRRATVVGRGHVVAHRRAAARRLRSPAARPAWRAGSTRSRCRRRVTIARPATRPATGSTSLRRSISACSELRFARRAAEQLDDARLDVRRCRGRSRSTARPGRRRAARSARRAATWRTRATSSTYLPSTSSSSADLERADLVADDDAAVVDLDRRARRELRGERRRRSTRRATATRLGGTGASPRS